MRYLILLLLLSFQMSLSAAVVVAHNDVPVSNLDESKIRDFLLGRTTAFANGQTVVIVLCMDSAADDAMKKIVDRSANLLLRGWKRLVFSGSGAMPLQAATIQDAIALVARTPGAITILPLVESVPQTCRIIPLGGAGK